jgi:protein SCO1
MRVVAAMAVMIVALVALTRLGTLSASAHELTPQQLGALKFEQRLGAQVPLDLTFRDQDGNAVALREYMNGQRAVILTLNYFHCQNLCPLELEGLAGALNEVSFTLGDEFDIVSVSIDPREGPSDATATRLRALRGYDRREHARGWHVLTGDQVAIDRLAGAVGFSYTYDADANEYAHPLGLMVLTPGGQVSRYLFGLDYAANDVRLALVDASTARIGSLIDRAVMLCYHYDPLTGRYTPLALNLLRGGAGAGVLVILLFLGWFWRRDLRPAQHGAGAASVPGPAVSE